MENAYRARATDVNPGEGLYEYPGDNSWCLKALLNDERTGARDSDTILALAASEQEALVLEDIVT